MTFICICLFIGAMGKSAQVPLHVWLPDSMEGPTPISALIHAATMVTAGIFMVARMSPLFEFSEYALNFVLFIGATTALFMGFLGIVNNDIKRVVAYSTLSQLGYMTVALGVSAYSFGIFHLMTHAFFKALLFLAAGSVIIGMHHEQDMRKMGGLCKYMPITAITCWIGSLALIGTPFFSGFYSKDLIIDAVKHQHHLHPDNAIATYAYWCVMIGVFVTAFYTFRLLFMTFHGKPRWEASTAHDAHAGTTAHETHAEAGTRRARRPCPRRSCPRPPRRPAAERALGHGRSAHRAGDSVGAHRRVHLQVAALRRRLRRRRSSSARRTSEVLREIGESVGNWLALRTARAHEPGVLDHGCRRVHRLGAVHQVAAPAGHHRREAQAAALDPREQVLLRLVQRKRPRAPAAACWARSSGRAATAAIIDGVVVDGSARTIGFIAGIVRRVQSGFLYSYAFWMVIGLAVMLGWFLTHVLNNENTCRGFRFFRF